ncbi:GUMAP protein [Ureaplasma canigenitalium]|uniref:GUMAP protein n=1 Tax=Ureaplasma canigenitalium TaxID=42092 RepID=UPI0004E1DAED|nr:GUMAP protein [Ureaplasma canigenitalium]
MSNKNSKIYSKSNKKKITAITSSIALVSSAAIAGGVVGSKSLEHSEKTGKNTVASHLYATPNYPSMYNGKQVIQINSGAANFKKGENIAEPQPYVYSFAELVESNFQVDTALQKALKRGVKMQLNGTSYNLSEADGWRVKTVVTSGNEAGVFVLEKNGTSEEYAFYDTTGYHNIPIVWKDENLSYTKGELIRFFGLLPSTKANEKNLNSSFLRLDSRSVFEENVVNWIKSVLKLPLTDIGVARIGHEGDFRLIVSGKIEGQTHVYTINGLPNILRYDEEISVNGQTKHNYDFLPTFEDLKQHSFDYKEAIKAKFHNITENSFFGGLQTNGVDKFPLDKVILNSDEGYLTIEDHASKKAYFANNNTGYSYFEQERGISTLQADNGLDLEDLIDEIKTISKFGTDDSEKAVSLNNIISSKIFTVNNENILLKKNFNIYFSRVFYSSKANKIVVIDETINNKKVFVFKNLPKVSRSNGVFKDNTNGANIDTTNNLFSLAQLAKNFDSNATSPDQIENQTVNIMKENLFKNKGKYLETVFIPDVDTNDQITVSDVTNTNTNEYKLKTGTKYPKIKKIHFAKTNEDIYILYGHSFNSERGRKIFTDNKAFQRNQNKVVKFFLPVKDVDLAQLNDYVTNTTGIKDSFNKDTSRILRFEDSTNGDKFIIVNTENETDVSKILLIYDLPKVITTDLVFNGYDDKVNINTITDEVVKEIKTELPKQAVDATLSVTSSTDIIHKFLNEIAKRHNNDNSKLEIDGIVYDYENTVNKTYPENSKTYFDFDLKKDRNQIALVKNVKNGSSTVEKKEVQLIDVKKQPKNQRGLLPSSVAIKWNVDDLQTLEFIKKILKADDHSTTTPNNGKIVKQIKQELLDPTFIRNYVGSINEGRIIFEPNEGILTYIDENLQESVVFYGLQKVTDTSLMFEEEGKRLGSNYLGYVIDQAVNNFNSDFTNDYNKYKNLNFVINQNNGRRTEFGLYTIDASATAETLQKFSSDTGPNNGERSFETDIYQLTKDRNKIKVYDDIQYLQPKTANALFRGTPPLEEYRQLILKVRDKHTYKDGVSLDELKTIAPTIVDRLTKSANDESYYFYYNNMGSVQGAHNKPAGALLDTKVFFVTKKSKDGKHDYQYLVVAGSREYETKTQYAILPIYDLPNIYEEDEVVDKNKHPGVSFTFPTNDEIISKNGNYLEALKDKLNSANIFNQGTKIYDFDYRISPNENNRFTVAETNIQYLVGDNSKRNYVQLYTGVAGANFGTIIFTKNGSRIPDFSSIEYSKTTDRSSDKVTYGYWKAFSGNDTTEKKKQLEALFTQEFKNNNKPFNITAQTTVDVDFPNARFVIYEKGKNSADGKILVVYNIARVADEKEIFTTKDNATGEYELELLKPENDTNLRRTVTDRFTNNKAALVKNNLFLGIDVRDSTGTEHFELQFVGDRPIIVANNKPVYFVTFNHFSQVPDNVFNNESDKFRKFITDKLVNNEFTNQLDINDTDEGVQVVKKFFDDRKTSDSGKYKDVKKIFKLGLKFVAVGEDNGEKYYYVFNNLPLFVSDQSEQVRWGTIYEAMEAVDNKGKIRPEPNQFIVKKFIAESKGIQFPLQAGQTGNIPFGEHRVDIANTTITLEYNANHSVRLFKLRNSNNQDVDVFVASNNAVPTVDTAEFSTLYNLNTKADIDTLFNIVAKIKEQEKLSTEEKNGNKIFDANTALSSFNKIKLTETENGRTYTYDKAMVDYDSQILWLIDTSKNHAKAYTGFVATSETYIHDKGENSLLKIDEVVERSFNVRTIIQNYLLTQGGKNIDTFNFPDNDVEIRKVDEYYVLKRNGDDKTLVLKDITVYHKDNPIEGDKLIPNHKRQFKVIFDALLKQKTIIKYSDLVRSIPANDQSDINVFIDDLKGKIGNEQDPYLRLVASNVNGRPNNKIVVYIDNKQTNKHEIYLIDRLPRDILESNIQNPTVYDFIKYTGNDDLRMKNAVKNVLDPTNNKTNLNIEVRGENFEFNKIIVGIDRVTKKITLRTEDGRDLDSKFLSYIPNYKHAEIVYGRESSAWTVYDALDIKNELKKLKTDSTLDKTTDNLRTPRTENQIPQKEATVAFLQLPKIAMMFTKTGLNINDYISNINKVSIEYYITELEHSDNDRIIIRRFDSNNNVIEALVITNFIRVVDNTHTELNLNDENFYTEIVGGKSASKAIETKLTSNFGNSAQIDNKLDLYKYPRTMKVSKDEIPTNYVVEDTTNKSRKIYILNTTEYVDDAVDIEREISNIKEFYQTLNRIKGAANRNNDKGILVSDLNNTELTNIVNEYGEGLDPSSTYVRFDSTKERLIFTSEYSATSTRKAYTKKMVGINLPIIIESQNLHNGNLPTLDHLFKNVNNTKSVDQVWSEFFKDNSNYTQTNGEIEVIDKAKQSTPYKLKVSDLVVEFNLDNSLLLKSASTKKFVNIIVPDNIVPENIIAFNANEKNAHVVYDLLKTVPLAEKDKELTFDTTKYQHLLFFSDEGIPSNFFTNTNNVTDAIKYTYYPDLDRVIFKNTYTNHTLVYYNVPRVIEKKDAYTIKDIVDNDKSVTDFLSNKLSNPMMENGKQKEIKWGFYTLQQGTSTNKLRVTNGDRNSDTIIYDPNNKVQLYILDDENYHIANEKVNVQQLVTKVFFFEEWAKKVDKEFSVDPNQPDVTLGDPSVTPPNFLTDIISNFSLGNIDIASAKAFKIKKDTQAKNNIIVIYGENKTTHAKHVVVLSGFPHVEDLKQGNAKVPTTLQLARTFVEKSKWLDGDAILNEAILGLVRVGQNELLSGGTDFPAEGTNVSISRSADANDKGDGYIYRYNGKQKHIATEKKIPKVYALETTGIVNNNALIVYEFDQLYTKANKTDGAVLYKDVKNSELLKRLIQSDRNNRDIKNDLLNLDDNTKIIFDKATQRIFVLQDDYLVIYGNIIKVTSYDTIYGQGRLLYDWREVVGQNSEKSRLILQKLNALGGDSHNLNGYILKPPYQSSNIQNVDVYTINTGVGTDLDQIFFVDQTLYLEHDARNFSYTNLVGMVNLLKQKASPLFDNQTKQYIYQDVKVDTIGSADLNSIVSTLGFKEDANNLDVGLANGNILAIRGTDSTTNKIKVVKILIPQIFDLDQTHKLIADDISKANGNTIEEKIANATKTNLIKQAKAIAAENLELNKQIRNRNNSITESPERGVYKEPLLNEDENVIVVNGVEIQLNDPSLVFETVKDPNQSNKTQVVIKQGDKILTVIDFKQDLPVVRVKEWSSTNATPLMTYNYLKNIEENPLFDENIKNNQKTLLFKDLDGKVNKNLLNIDFIKSVVDTENIASFRDGQAIFTIEYNKHRNEIILRARKNNREDQIVFVNVTKVIDAEHLYRHHEGFVLDGGQSLDSNSPKQTIDNKILNTSDKNLNDKSSNIKDDISSYYVRFDVPGEDVSAQFKDALTYKYLEGGTDQPVYVFDRSHYEITPIDGKKTYSQGIVEFLRLYETVSSVDYTPISEVSSPILIGIVNNYGISDVKLHKHRNGDHDVLYIIGKKEITRDSKKVLVDFVIQMNNLPIAISNPKGIPSESAILNNFGDFNETFKQSLEDASFYPQIERTDPKDPNKKHKEIVYSGATLVVPLKSVVQQDDGSILITDGAGNEVLIPDKNSTKIYYSYDVNEKNILPGGAIENGPQDYRFSDIRKAKELYDLIDNTGPVNNTLEHPLTPAIKNHPLLKKILDDYISNHVNNWDLSLATIIYDRSKNLIVIRDNQSIKPRVLTIKNTPKIIALNDLYEDENEFALKLNENNYDVKKVLEQYLNSLGQQKEKNIGRKKPNSQSVFSTYNNLLNVNVKNDPVDVSKNIYGFSYDDSVTFIKDNNGIPHPETNETLYVIVDTTHLTNNATNKYNNFVNLYNQTKLFKENEIQVVNDVIDNPELRNKIIAVFTNNTSLNGTKFIYHNNTLIVYDLDASNVISNITTFTLPSMVNNSDASFISKDDIYNSNDSLPDLILKHYQNDNLFKRDANGKVHLSPTVTFNPDEVRFVVSPDGKTVEIRPKDPSQDDSNIQYPLIVMDTFVVPKRAVIDAIDSKHRIQNDLDLIYDLTHNIFLITLGQDRFIPLKDNLKDNPYLRDKLIEVFQDDVPSWFTDVNTMIKYDPNTRVLIIDDNNTVNNHILKINNVLAVFDNENEYTIFDDDQIFREFTLEKAKEYRDLEVKDKEGKTETQIKAELKELRRKWQKDLIRTAYLKAIGLINQNESLNGYSINVSKDIGVPNNISYVPHTDSIVKYVPNEVEWREHFKLIDTTNKEYYFFQSQYFAFSRLDVKELFIKDNIRYKNFVSELTKSGGLTFNQILVDKYPELAPIYNEIKEDANFDGVDLKLEIGSYKNLSITGRKGKYHYTYIINDAPPALSEKDIGYHISTIDEVIDNAGNLNDTLTKELLKQDRYPRNNAGEINLDGTLIKPEDVLVEARDDGTVEFKDKRTDKAILVIEPTKRIPKFNVIKDSIKLDDAVKAKQIYTLIKRANPLILSRPDEKNLSKDIIENDFINQNVILPYQEKTLDDGLVKSYKNWTVEYKPNTDQIIFKGLNEESVNSFTRVVVINNAIKVINASELYNIFDAIDYNENELTFSPYIKVPHNEINKQLINKTNIGNYLVSNPTLDTTNTYHNAHGDKDKYVNNQYNIIKDDAGRSIVIIDDHHYLPFLNGKASDVFLNYNGFYFMNKVLSNNHGEIVDLVNKPLRFGLDLVKYLKSIGITKTNNLKETKIKKIKDYFVIIGVDDDGKQFILKVFNLPSIMSKNETPFFGIEDVIKARGDQAKAYLSILQDETKHKRDKDGFITVGKERFKPDNVVVEIDGNNNVVVYPKDKNGKKGEKPLFVVLNNKDLDSIIVDFKTIDGSIYHPSYLQDWIVSLQNVQLTIIDPNNKPELLLKDTKLIQDLNFIKNLQEDFDLKSELATIRYDSESKQIIIKDNQPINPKVIIIRTDSLLNQETGLEHVEYRLNIDYNLIWIVLLSNFAGLIILAVIISIIIKKKKQRKLNKK